MKRQSKKRNPAPGFGYGEANAVARYIRSGGGYAVVYRVSPGRYGIQVTNPKTPRIKRNIEKCTPKWKAFLSGKVSPRKNKNPGRTYYYLETLNLRKEPLTLTWDNPAAAKAGVFNLNKMSWKSFPSRVNPTVKFSQKHVAELFGDRISGYGMVQVRKGRIDPEYL